MRLRQLIAPLQESSHHFTPERAKAIAKAIGLKFNGITLDQFEKGLEVETEHEKDPETAVTHKDTDIGKIAWAHLKELPDYYTRLKAVESLPSKRRIRRKKR